VNIGRRSGILLHLTSLPGRFGIGDLGPASRKFIDFLAETEQRLWCVLPLGPTGKENSPYQCPSAFAGNPLLISPEALVEHGYLSASDLRSVPKFPANHVDFPEVRRWKESLLQKAFTNFSETREYRAFERRQAWWLDSHAEFMSLLDANEGAAWPHFDPRIKAHPVAIRYHKFVQFEFFRQWRALHEACKAKKILVMGDMPFYVEHNSADVWSHRDLFDLDSRGNPRTVGGVPPDYFAKDGQLWGTPTYRWPRIAKTGFRWWVDRFRKTFEVVDLLRLDHFRGFEGFWSVKANRSTARVGRWVKSPGHQLLAAVQRKLGDLPIVAENLGIITPEVESLRTKFGFPGISVLQFGFGDDATHRPNNYVRNLAGFTGTHDNDTSVGWWKSLQRSARRSSNTGDRETLARAKSFLQTEGRRDIHWSMIQAVFTSVADLAIAPMQDLLGLDSAARMNYPGRAKGNWGWRLQEKQITPALVRRLRELTEVSGR
jgi:4-alpha-glucanotransferase